MKTKQKFLKKHEKMFMQKNKQSQYLKWNRTKQNEIKIKQNNKNKAEIRDKLFTASSHKVRANFLEYFTQYSA